MADAFEGADEGDFLELLIANERILEWVDELQTPGNAARKKAIVMELRDLVDTKPSYAEEARRAGVVPILTQILSRTEDEEVMDAVSQIMVACSGPMASGGKVRDYTYGPVTVRIREGALGDGLGARVWTVAHILCKELVQYPSFVSGHGVLEIGAGCGVCGVVAAKLRSTTVVLTDVEGPVLRNLRDCVQLNSSATDDALAALRFCSPSPTTPPGAMTASKQPAADGSAVHQPEQHSITAAGAASPSPQRGGCNGAGCAPATTGEAADSWQVDNMVVRKLDWLESLKHMQRQQLAAGGSTQQGAEEQSVPQEGGTGEEATSGTSGIQGGGEEATAGGVVDVDAKEFYANDLLRMADDYQLPGDEPPDVPLTERYSRIIGTDIMYEPMHAALVAAVLAHRLAPGGAALLCCAVRQARTFAAFEKECERWGMRYRKKQVQPAVEYGGIMGRDEEYEGGFLLMAVDHEAAPCDSWHREGFA